MKTIVKSILLIISLVMLTACGNKLKDGIYKNEIGYTLEVSGKEITLDAFIARAKGTVQGDTIELDVNVLGLASDSQSLTYEVKGDTVEVKDESGNLMVFERQKE